jgi:hypothetical protein
MSAQFKSIALGVATILVSVILFPIIFTGVAAVTATPNLATFTGVSTLNLLVPLLALIGLFGSGVWSIVAGARGKANTQGSIMKAVYGELIIFITLILFPIIVTAFYTLYTTDNGTYTGFQEVVTIMPLLIFIGALFGGGLLMFQGITGRGGGSRKHHKHYR